MHVPQAKSKMYIRFVTNEISLESNQKLGIFHAVRYLRDDGGLSDYELSVADELFNWFTNNLESPLDNLNKQRLRKSESCISWFKDNATEHITKARGFESLLKTKDIIVEVLKTNKPGKIVYEDEIQIFALPYKRF